MISVLTRSKKKTDPPCVKTLHTAVSPLANGPSQPSIENILRNAQILGFSTDIDENALKTVSDHFRNIAKWEGFPIGSPVEYDLNQYEHQGPGGMMSNYRAELARRGLENQLEDLLKEIAQIRKELGYPIMVTPLSQYIGAQAVLNHTTGERYKIVTDEIIKYALGHFGELAAPVDKDVMNRIKRLPRTKELLNWQPPENSIQELRKKFGPELSDEEFLLRILSSNQAAVDEVLSAGPKNYDYQKANKPVMTLINELTKQNDQAYIHIKKGDFSLTLQ